MGEARRKKLAAIRKVFLPPPPSEKESLHDNAKDALAAWWAKRLDDLMFKELTK